MTDWFAAKLAVVTGGGSGMGRELVRQLAARGCSVATCDLYPETAAATATLAQDAAAGAGVLVTSHTCDVSDEAQVLRFRDELLQAHAAGHLDLVFSNAGIGGGESFVSGRREDWERVFATDWYGVYYCARAFLPLLIASPEGVLVNTSSVNGMWASLGPGVPQTAYSTAKFAIRGFTEALIEDLRTHAPHVRAAVVIPGHVGTDIIVNSLRARGAGGRHHPGRRAGRPLADPHRRRRPAHRHLRPHQARVGLRLRRARQDGRRRWVCTCGGNPGPFGIKKITATAAARWR